MITFNSVLLILLTGSVSSFEITGVSQSSMNVSPGESVRLICTVSRAWEFCTWSLQDGEARCSLEWKRSKGGVVIEDCDQDLRRRVKIAGDYGAGECGLDIYNLVEADSGTWQCEMEEYKFGDWTSGEKVTAEVSLSVRQRAPTEYPIIVEREFRTHQQPPPQVTTEAITPTSPHHDVIGPDDTTPTIVDDSTTDVADNSSEENTLGVTAKDQSRSSSTILGVCLSAGTLVAVTAVAVIIWRRKYKASLASGHGQDDWVVGDGVTEIVVPSMSDLMKRETD